MRALFALLVAARQSPFPDLAVCDGDSAPAYPDVTKFMTDAASQRGDQLSSNHFIAVVPHSAAFTTGEAAISAALYAALPRLPVEGGTGFESKLAKVVLVGVSEGSDQEGFWIPPCGELIDKEAAEYLAAQAPKMVNGPNLLAAKADPALANQVPFVDLVLGERAKGGVLPVVMGKQSQTLAAQMAGLLSKLVGVNGPYEQHRVLFVFAADLSRDLEKKWAQPRDAETVSKMTASGFTGLLPYFDDLVKAAAAGEHRRPFDFAGVLAAVKLAETMGLAGAKLRVGSSGDFIGATDRNDLEKVRGYASVVFFRDDRSAGEKQSAAAKDPELPSATTSTTAAPTTMVGPPTMEPAPFGTPPMFLEARRAKIVAAAARASARFGGRVLGL